MKGTDIIMVNVTGTNGTTRKQKTISRRFNGQGLPLNDDGAVDASTQERLLALPTGGGSKPPEFPVAEFQAATNAGNVDKMKQIQLAYGEQLAAYEKQQGGGNENLQIAKSVLNYTKQFHGFHEEDGDWFVMKLENLDVISQTLHDQRTLYTVTGTAVFGA